MKKLMIGAGIAVALAVPAIAMQAAGGHDMHGMHEKMGPMTRAQVRAQVAERFAAVDTNKDGAVTRAEADAHRESMKAKWQAGRAERRAKMFDMLDVDKNGQLSRSEFTAPRGEGMEGGHRGHGMGMRGHGMRGMGMMGGGMGKMWFERLDTNKDGKVTLAEAEAQALAMFDRADANKDGTVTPEERKAAHEKMRAEWKAKRG